jgi:signal transduction histidine kinase
VALRKIIACTENSVLRKELQHLLESERTVIQVLRTVCEQLHPTGIDDPLGLPSVLRLQVDRIQPMWPGTITFMVENARQPVDAQIQFAAMKITLEALTNAVKHAVDATQITVRLHYPTMPQSRAELSIRDDGCTDHVIAPKPGNLGIRGMRERARSVGGDLQICRNQDDGTVVTFTFATREQEAFLLA